MAKVNRRIPSLLHRTADCLSNLPAFIEFKFVEVFALNSSQSCFTRTIATMAEKLAVPYNVRRSIVLFPRVSFSLVASSDDLSMVADLGRKPFDGDLLLPPP